MDVCECVLKALDRAGIAYDLAVHPPAHTMRECEGPARLLGGVVPKNLFLRPRRQEQFYLCLMHPDTPFRASCISRQAGASRLGFASEEEMTRLLLTRPGSASPLALLFEEAREVRLLMDERLRGEERLIFHPCDNTRSVAMSRADFLEKVLAAAGHEVIWVSTDPETETEA